MPYNIEKPIPHSARDVSAGYGELNLVEAPAIELLKTLGWQHADLFKEKIGRLGTEGRESESQVILPNRLRAALQRLNPGLSPLPALTCRLARRCIWISQ